MILKNSCEICSYEKNLYQNCHLQVQAPFTARKCFLCFQKSKAKFSGSCVISLSHYIIIHKPYKFKGVH